MLPNGSRYKTTFESSKRERLPWNDGIAGFYALVLEELSNCIQRDSKREGEGANNNIGSCGVV
jgi:hypothetical protein